jgi:hypothetical protein
MSCGADWGHDRADGLDLNTSKTTNLEANETDRKESYPRAQVCGPWAQVGHYCRERRSRRPLPGCNNQRFPLLFFKSFPNLVC